MTELTDIAEVVRVFDLPLSTLRYWERRGLVTSHRRAGRRCYDTDQLYRIALIRHWRDTGLLGVEDIRAMLERSPASRDWKPAVEEHISRTDARISTLRAARTYLEHVRDCRHAGPPDSCPDFRALVTLPG